MRPLNFRDMGLRPKLAILITVLSAPILVLLVLQYESSREAVSITGAEQDGLAYVTEGPMELVYEVQRHRLLAAAVLRGEESFRADLDASSAKIDTLVGQLGALDTKYGSAATGELANSVAARWEAVKLTPDTTPDAVLFAHTTLIEQSLIPLIFSIGNDSNLYRDPEVNTLTTSIGISSDLVRASESSSRAAAHALAVNDARGVPQGDVNRELAAAQIQAAATARESTRRWVEQAMASDATFRAELVDVLARSNGESDRLATRIEASLEESRIDTAEVVGLGQSAIETSNALFDSGAALVSSELSDRKSNARTGQFILLGFSALAFIAAIAVASAIAASITRPIQRLAFVADQMSLGQLDVEIDVESSNEIGQLAESLRRMQASLTGAIERLRARKAA